MTVLNLFKKLEAYMYMEAILITLKWNKKITFEFQFDWLRWGQANAIE